MVEEKYLEYTGDVIKQLNGDGAFLVTGSKEKNIMTIGWGSVGRVWSKPVFIVLVRKSRYSHGLLEKESEFCVCVPKYGTMSEELSVCGTRSGRDTDKAKELGLKMAAPDKISVPYLEKCSMAFECRVVYKTDMTYDSLEKGIVSKYYGEGDLHTIYFGEILKFHKMD